MARLPVEHILDDIRHTLGSNRCLVIQAPPGAGKTTLVPPSLLDAPWLDGRTIVMLEPRRLAARAAAEFMARSRGERVGDTVGYRMRGDTRVGPRTRIEVVTEGVLTRRIQRDPTLDGVGVLIFDEFHERSVDADLALALSLRTQSVVRDDLRLVVMSATLDGDAVSRLLGGAPIITSEGRTFPVETRYVAPRPKDTIESTLTSVAPAALRDDAGDILAFLPGAAEIRRAAALLEARDLGDAIVVPLLGALSHEEQDRAILPDPRGRRKIVLSTAIAETSLTIEGVRVVIDSGLSRVPRFSPRTGMTRLDTVRVSRASADQRRGRAGRLGPGVCYRLWPEHEDHHLLASTPPEIANADLAPLALSLAAAGAEDPLELSWIDPPARAAFAQARELLRTLGALDADGAVTTHGTAMNDLPAHPRIAHMLLRSRSLGAGLLAAELAALLGERDVLRSVGGPVDPDIALRIDALRPARASAFSNGGPNVDRDAVRRVRAEADRLSKQLGFGDADRDSAPPALAGALLALAYPDRIGQRRAGARGRFLLRNGRGVEIDGDAAIAAAPWIVAADVDERQPESRVFLAASLHLDEIRDDLGDQISNETAVEIDDGGAVRAWRRERLGAIVLRETAIANPDAAAVRRALLDAIVSRGIASLAWTDSARRYRERIAFVARHESSWPDVSDDALAPSVEEWLGPALDGVRTLNDISGEDLAAGLARLLDWRQRQELDRLAPSFIDVPSGSRIAVDYSDPSAPVLAVRIQEVFGWTESPRVLDGRVVLTMHLLSPAHRPVQVTRDLRGFWQTSYFDVRKDLRGRYPKHDWPENPLSAVPTRRAKPRR